MCGVMMFAWWNCVKPGQTCSEDNSFLTTSGSYLLVTLISRSRKKRRNVKKVEKYYNGLSVVECHLEPLAARS